MAGASAKSRAVVKASSSASKLLKRPEVADDPTLPALLEFQWPSTAIANAPIPLSARRVTWVVTSMVFALIALAGLIPVDQVVTSRGIVVSQTPTILIQPLETAIVRSIDVHRGQRVHAGQILARLDPTFAAADVGAFTALVASLGAEVSRLRAEAQGIPFTYSGDDPVLTLQAAIYNQRQAERNFHLKNYTEKIAGLQSSIASSDAEAANNQKRLAIATQIEGMRQDLQRKHYDTTLNSLIATDTRLKSQGDFASARDAGTTGRKTLEALKAERDAYEQNWKAQVSQDLADKTQKLSDARETLAKATRRKELVELRADREANVQSVAKVSIGSVLQSGQLFITLVPADAPLEIDANVLGRDNGFVHVGDPVSIKFDTFPYSQYGMASGTIRIVSPDSFTAQDEARAPMSAVPVPASSSEPFYLARIAIERVALHDVPAGFQLMPGMPVTADIKVGKRTVLSYLLGRVLPLAQEGMREPGN